jgi:hypothetical protein
VTMSSGKSITQCVCVCVCACVCVCVCVHVCVSVIQCLWMSGSGGTEIAPQGCHTARVTSCSARYRGDRIYGDPWQASRPCQDTHTQMHKHTRRCTHTGTHKLMHTHTNTHTHIQDCADTHMDTHGDTYSGNE